MPSKKFARSAALFGIVPLCSPVWAQTSFETNTLQETVVTATRQPSRVSEVIGDLTVIDREEIEASNAQSLSEILARQPGMQRSSNGGLGTSSSVFTRGTESHHTLLLIDGVPYGSATLGAPSFETIPLAQIDRIEILRGPASSLYGSAAVGGVIQIFTRKGAEGFTPNASARVGSDRFGELSAGLSAGSGAWSYALQAQHVETEGFSATNANVPFGSFNPDRDGFRQGSVTGRVGYAFNPDWSADLGALYSDGVTQFDDGPSGDSRSVVRASQLRLGVEGRISAAWKALLRVAQNRDTNNSIEAAFPGAFETTQRQAVWQNDVQTALGSALVAVESLEQQVDSSTAYAVTQRTIDSPLGGLSGAAGVHHWQASVRRDVNSQFGGSTTGLLGYGIDVAKGVQASASYGTSFVAPSFNQLYFPGFGNSSLQPERGKNREFSLTWSRGMQFGKLTYFDNRIRDLIATVCTMSGCAPENVQRARIEGLTLSHELQRNAWTLTGHLDWMKPRNQVDGKKLPRRADWQGGLRAAYATGAWDLGGDLLAVDERFDNASNTLRLPGYATLDLFGNWKFAPNWSGQVRLNNIADKVYETAFGYNQAGRQLFVGVSYAPKR